MYSELIKKQTERNQKLLKDFSDEEINLLQKLLNKLLLSSQKYLIFN
jgi:DNA-binding MarR family transcriptional regulator